MEKIIGTYNYGLCIFSMDTMKQFLKDRKVRSKKVLALFQINKHLYLDSQKQGIWVPIPSINSGEYVISIEGYDNPFDDKWTQVLSYDGFNIEVKNGIWVSDMGAFLKFNETEYEGEGREITSEYGTVEYFSNREKWFKDLEGKISYSDYWYDVPEGKYLLTISGFARKEIVDDNGVNYGFQFKFKKVDAFTSYKNPREENYEFNTEWIHTTMTGVVHWLPKKESGVKWPLDKENHDKMIVIPFENNQNVEIMIRFDIVNQTEERMNRCRLKKWTKKPEGFELESGKEYPIYEEIYKRGKRYYKELGRIVMD